MRRSAIDKILYFAERQISSHIARSAAISVNSSPETDLKMKSEILNNADSKLSQIFLSTEQPYESVLGALDVFFFLMTQ